MYQTVTLAGTYTLPDGTPAKGTIEIIPSEKVIIDSGGNVILSGRLQVKLGHKAAEGEVGADKDGWIQDGKMSVALPATDDPALTPTGFGYTVSAKLHHHTIPAVSFSLPAALGTVDVAKVTTVDPSTFVPDANYVTPAELDAAVAGVVVDTSGLEAEIATKADAGEVDAALASKADVSSLEAKADATRVTALEDERTTGRLSEASLAATIGALAPTKSRGTLTYGRKVGFVGDSHTEATAGVTDNKYGYPRQTVQHLGGWFASEANAVYAGIGGQRSDQITARVDAVLDQGVDVLVYAAGANDANQNYSTEQYMANVAAAVEKCKARGVIPIIVGCPPSNDTGTQTGQRWREFYNLALASYCLQNNVQFADIYPILIDPATNFQRADLTNSTDGHIRDKGHYYIAVEVAAAIKRAVGAQPLDYGHYGLYNQVAAPWMAGTIDTAGTNPTGWSLIANSGPAGIGATTKIVADQWGVLPQPPFGSTAQPNRWFEAEVNNTDTTTPVHREFQISVTTRGVTTDTMAIGCYFMVEDMGGATSYLDGILAHNGTQQTFTPRANGANIPLTAYYPPGIPLGSNRYARGPVWRTFQFGSANTQVARWIFDVGPRQHLKLRIGLPVVRNLTYSGYPGSDLAPLLG